MNPVDPEQEQMLIELRSQMRAAIAEDVFRYDQHLAQYYDIVKIWANVGDFAHHELGDDLIVPSVGAVVLKSLQDLEIEHGYEKVINEASVVISVAIAEIIRLEHENIQLRKTGEE